MKIEKLQSLCVVLADFDIWSGQTRLLQGDIRLGDGGEIPPHKLAQLGSKRVYDPEELKGFHRVKTEARRFLMSIGMPFMNGFAIPASLADDAISRLNAVKSEFDSLKNQLLAKYDTVVENWIKENAEYEEAIRKGVLPKSAVANRINFDFDVFFINPVADSETSTNNLNRQVENLGEDLLDEVAKDAGDFFEKYLSGNARCSVNSQMTFKRIRNKLDGLAFLNGNLAPLVGLLDETLKGFTLESNKDGRYIAGPFLYQVIATVLIMSDRSKIEAFASGKLTLDGMTAQVTPARENAQASFQEGAPLEQARSAKVEKSAAFEPLSDTEQASLGLASTPLSDEEISEDLDNFFANHNASKATPEVAKEQATNPTENSVVEVANVSTAEAPAIEPSAGSSIPTLDEEELEGYF